jgi:flagellar biosynthesis/type III secretory pathway protein FliH
VTAEQRKGDVGALFADSVRSYIATTQEIAQQAQQRAGEAARAYARALQEQQQRQQQEETPRSFDEAVLAYPAAAQAAQQGWQTAVQAYQEELRAAAEETAKGQEKAFREYVGGLKKAWSQVDPATIDPASIVAIQQAMLAAACAGR